MSRQLAITIASLFGGTPTIGRFDGLVPHVAEISSPYGLSGGASRADRGPSCGNDPENTRDHTIERARDRSIPEPQHDPAGRRQHALLPAIAIPLFPSVMGSAVHLDRDQERRVGEIHARARPARHARRDPVFHRPAERGRQRLLLPRELTIAAAPAAEGPPAQRCRHPRADVRVAVEAVHARRRDGALAGRLAACGGRGPRMKRGIRPPSVRGAAITATCREPRTPQRDKRRATPPADDRGQGQTRPWHERVILVPSARPATQAARLLFIPWPTRI